MTVLLAIVAVLFLGFGGFAVFASAQGGRLNTGSDIQLILAVLCFGFGFLLLGMAEILSRLASRAPEKPRL
jgi:hypothetical protein